MSHSTVELLTTLTDLNAEDADRQLNLFARRILTCLRDEGVCHVTGIGTFTRHDGSIDFDPEPSLNRVVNARYEEQQVLEVTPSDRRGGEAEWTPVADLGEQKEDIADADADADRHEPIPAPTPVGSNDDRQADSVQSASPRRSIRESRSPRHRRRMRENSGGRRIALILVPVVIIAAVLAGIFLFLPRNEATEPSQDIVAEQPVVADDTSESAGAEAEGETETDEQLSTADEQATPEQAPPDEPGEQTLALDRSTTGYTLIVGSSLDESSAYSQIREFAELDLPLGVLDSEGDDTTRYRLAVGRFDSIAEADSVRQSMSDVLPQGTWVWRIR